MFVVFALDGTLALTEHRADFLNWPGSTKDWRGFFREAYFRRKWQRSPCQAGGALCFERTRLRRLCIRRSGAFRPGPDLIANE